MLVNSGDPRSGEPFDRLRSTLNGFAEIFNRQTLVRASGRNTPPVLPVFARNCLSRINELFTSLFSVSSLFSFSSRVFLASSSLHGFFYGIFTPSVLSRRRGCEFPTGDKLLSGRRVRDIGETPRRFLLLPCPYLLLSHPLLLETVFLQFAPDCSPSLFHLASKRYRSSHSVEMRNIPFLRRTSSELSFSSGENRKNGRRNLSSLIESEEMTKFFLTSCCNYTGLYLSISQISVIHHKREAETTPAIIRLSIPYISAA